VHCACGIVKAAAENPSVPYGGGVITGENSPI
jgi:hypothetical protein